MEKQTSQTEELGLTVVHHCGPKPAVAGITVHLSTFQPSRLLLFSLLFLGLGYSFSLNNVCVRLTGQTRPPCARVRVHPFKTDEVVRAMTSRSAVEMTTIARGWNGEGSRAPARGFLWFLVKMEPAVGLVSEPETLLGSLSWEFLIIQANEASSFLG